MSKTKAVDKRALPLCDRVIRVGKILITNNDVEEAPPKPCQMLASQDGHVQDLEERRKESGHVFVARGLKQRKCLQCFVSFSDDEEEDFLAPGPCDEGATYVNLGEVR